jgi:hypothetical protein
MSASVIVGTVLPVKVPHEDALKPVIFVLFSAFMCASSLLAAEADRINYNYSLVQRADSPNDCLLAVSCKGCEVTPVGRSLKARFWMLGRTTQV